jgi:hypothetical protein
MLPQADAVGEAGDAVFVLVLMLVVEGDKYD